MMKTSLKPVSIVFIVKYIDVVFGLSISKVDNVSNNQIHIDTSLTLRNKIPYSVFYTFSFEKR